MPDYLGPLFVCLVLTAVFAALYRALSHGARMVFGVAAVVSAAAGLVRAIGGVM